MLRFENLLADKKLCDGRKNREIEPTFTLDIETRF